MTFQFLPVLNSLTIGIKPEREETKRRITERLKQRLANGMIEEVSELIRKRVSQWRDLTTLD